MVIGSTLLLAALAAQASPAVPGGCTDAARDNVGKPGCYLSAELAITSPPVLLYWHIVPAPSEAVARDWARRYAWASAVNAHRRWWLYVLSERAAERGLPRHHVAGPLRIDRGRPVVARFMESWFPPGMRTRVHTHAGPEAFYVIDGEQCTETPTERRTIRANESYIVAGGPHLQAAPKGRRSVVLILAPSGSPWMQLDDQWSGTGYCVH